MLQLLNMVSYGIRAGLSLKKLQSSERMCKLQYVVFICTKKKKCRSSYMLIKVLINIKIIKNATKTLKSYTYIAVQEKVLFHLRFHPLFQRQRYTPRVYLWHLYALRVLYNYFPIVTQFHRKVLTLFDCAVKPA